MGTTKVTIPNSSEGTSDLVAIPRKEYQEFLQMKAETEDALEKIKRGEEEYKQGKTRVVKSLDELM